MFKKLRDFIKVLTKDERSTLEDNISDKENDVITGVPTGLSNFYKSIEGARRKGIPMKTISLDCDDKKEIDN